MFYPNMNLLRYLLSLGILINHFNVLGGHDIPYFISHDRIGGFFTLSGFLMYHSYTRVSGLMPFVRHRARRILPTYIFIVLLCAFGGVLISTCSFAEYFKAAGFWKYLLANLSFLNWLAPSLPGVFTGPENMLDVVNGSLWTMKVEWLLDLSVPLFVWVTCRMQWRREYVAMVIILSSIIVRGWIWHRYEVTGNAIYEILSRQFISQMGFFYMGMLLYFWRDKMSRHPEYVAAIGVLLYVVGPYLPYGHIYMAPIAVPLSVVGISMIGRTISRFTHVNCISYNIFLIHYPVIQLCLWLGLNSAPVWVSFATVLIVTVALAYLTNRYIDRPFTHRRKMADKKKITNQQ